MLSAQPYSEFPSQPAPVPLERRKPSGSRAVRPRRRPGWLSCARPQGREARCGRREGCRRDLQSIVAQGTAISGCVTAAWTGSSRLPASGVVPCPPALLPKPSIVRLARRRTHRYTRDTFDITPPHGHPQPPRSPTPVLCCPCTGSVLRPLACCRIELSLRALYILRTSPRLLLPNRPRHGALVRTTPDSASCM